LEVDFDTLVASVTPVIATKSLFVTIAFEIDDELIALVAIVAVCATVRAVLENITLHRLVAIVAEWLVHLL